jgi:hypothetical protein
MLLRKKHWLATHRPKVTIRIQRNSAKVVKKTIIIQVETKLCSSKFILAGYGGTHL